jgi:hypothetical protein
MRRFNSPLHKVSVATPCPADWDRMVGGDRVRFCGQCQLNVYNLSAMSRDDAESLIARTEGRLCVRFYRRRDGSIITDDCPVGLRAVKRRALRIKQALASAVLGCLAGIGANAAVNKLGVMLLDSGIAWRPGVTQGTMIPPEKLHPQVVPGDYTVPRPTAKRPPKRSLK